MTNRRQRVLRALVALFLGGVALLVIIPIGSDGIVGDILKRTCDVWNPVLPNAEIFDRRVHDDSKLGSILRTAEFAWGPTYKTFLKIRANIDIERDAEIGIFRPFIGGESQNSVLGLLHHEPFPVYCELGIGDKRLYDRGVPLHERIESASKVRWLQCLTDSGAELSYVVEPRMRGCTDYTSEYSYYNEQMVTIILQDVASAEGQANY